MRILLFLVLLSSRTFGMDAVLTLPNLKPDEPVPAAHSLTLLVRPVDAISDSISKAELAVSPGSALTRVGPLLLDPDSLKLETGPVLRLTAMVVDAKATEIPPLAFSLQTQRGATISLATKPFPIKVSTNLQPGDEQKPKLFWGLLDNGSFSTATIVFLGILGFILLGSLVFFLLRFLRRKREHQLTPLERARNTLVALQNEQDAKVFSYRLVAQSKSLVEFLSSLDITDLTDSEALALLKNSSLPSSLQTALQEILRDSFEVRYAQASMPTETRERLYRRGLEILTAAEEQEKTKEAR